MQDGAAPVRRSANKRQTVGKNLGRLRSLVRRLCYGSVGSSERCVKTRTCRLLASVYTSRFLFVSLYIFLTPRVLVADLNRLLR